jgi:hypothetical protein
MQASFPIDPKFRKSIAPNIWYCKEEEKKKDGEREKEKKRERKRRRKWRKIRDRGRGRRHNFRSILNLESITPNIWYGKECGREEQRKRGGEGEKEREKEKSFFFGWQIL